MFSEFTAELSHKITYVKALEGDKTKRVLLQFEKTKKNCEKDTIAIHDREEYTDRFKELTKEFYLNF
jgi:tRNA1(Val) A37 N6-methylase TrmN6